MLNKTQIEATLTTTDEMQGWSDSGTARGDSERDAVGEEGIKNRRRSSE